MAPAASRDRVATRDATQRRAGTGRGWPAATPRAVVADSDVVGGQVPRDGARPRRPRRGGRLVGRREDEQADRHAELLEPPDLAGDEQLAAARVALEHVDDRPLSHTPAPGSAHEMASTHRRRRRRGRARRPQPGRRAPRRSRSPRRRRRCGRSRRPARRGRPGATSRPVSPSRTAVRDGGDVAGDDRAAARHRLEDDVRQPVAVLAPRRRRDGTTTTSARRTRPGSSSWVSRPTKSHAVAQTEPVGQPAEASPLRAVADDVEPPRRRSSAPGRRGARRSPSSRRAGPPPAGAQGDSGVDTARWKRSMSTPWPMRSGVAPTARNDAATSALHASTVAAPRARSARSTGSDLAHVEGVGAEAVRHAQVGCRAAATAAGRWAK